MSSTKNILITITGPSLTGKSTLAQLLSPYGFEELVSTTTRPMREGEINGIHYHFVSTSEFKEQLKQNQMIEHTVVGKNMYGVSKKSFDKVISKHKNGVVVVEPNGVSQVTDYCKKNDILLHRVFINNPLDILLQRFLQRFRDDKIANISNYANRLLDIIQKEQLEWVQPAMSGEKKYEQIFNDFSPENEKKITQEITFAVQKKISDSLKNELNFKPENVVQSTKKQKP